MSLISAMVHWCESLHGRVKVVDALRDLAEALDAESIAITRCSFDGNPIDDLLVFERGAVPVRGTELCQSFARALMGEYFSISREGSLWLRSVVESGADRGLTAFHRSRRLADLAVIPMAKETKFVDCLEIHFVNERSSVEAAFLNAFAGIISESWRNRRPGTLAESLSTQRRCAEAPGATDDILGPANPAGLSRAEYRICVLLSGGASVDAVRSKLNIRNSTLRTHLRNIYLKTETDGLGHLLSQLLHSAALSCGRELRLGAA